MTATSVSDPSSHHEAEIDAVGSFRFDPLPPGKYELQVLSLTEIPGVRVTVVAGTRVAANLVNPGTGGEPE